MRRQVFMWTNTLPNWITAVSFMAVIFLSGCTNESAETVATPVTETEQAAPKVKQNGVVYKPSGLALVMRKMYDNMKVVGAQIHNGETVTDSLLSGYETIISAEPTNPDEIDGKYYGFANMWLNEVEVARQNPTLENYNAVMASCVNCHNSYCPGPIPKIKKLQLVP